MTTITSPSSPKTDIEIVKESRMHPTNRKYLEKFMYLIVMAEKKTYMPDLFHKNMEN